jgi:hypothetical protein
MGSAAPQQQQLQQLVPATPQMHTYTRQQKQQVINTSQLLCLPVCAFIGCVQASRQVLRLICSRLGTNSSSSQSLIASSGGRCSSSSSSLGFRCQQFQAARWFSAEAAQSTGMPPWRTFFRQRQQQQQHPGPVPLTTSTICSSCYWLVQFKNESIKE